MKRLSKDDLEFIRWRIWEPLRRNLDYRGEYAKLKEKHGDPAAVEIFCSKWKLQDAIDPALSFDQILSNKKGETKPQAIRRVQGLFFDLYNPESDSAAFVNISDCIQGKYLRVYVNLEKSRNQIESEFKKILGEWLSKNRLEFHGIEKNKGTRLHQKTWESRFRVFDLAEQFTPFPKISAKLKIPIDTVHKQYRAAWRAVNPSREYLTRRKRERDADSASLRPLFPCSSCSTRECDKTRRPCKRVEDFLKKHVEYPQDCLLSASPENPRTKISSRKPPAD